MLEIADVFVMHRSARSKSAIRTSFGTMNDRHLVLLAIRDKNGELGVGESWCNFPRWAPAERCAAYTEVFIPFLRGKTVQTIAPFMREMESAFRGESIQAGAYGPLLSALSAIELALWDLQARKQNLPLNRLLFENPEKRVRIYGSGINPPLPFDLIDTYLARGVSLFKLKLGFGDNTDRDSIRALKKHLGSRAELAVDVNRKWTFDAAVRWLPFLEEHGIQWLEEPLRPDEEPRLPELAQLSPVPIAAGENVMMGPSASAETILNDSTQILQPDVTKYCSLSLAVELAKLTAHKQVRLVPHFLGSAPGQIASAHLASGCNACLVEWDINANPLHTDFFNAPIEIRDGAIELPTRPGVGWTFTHDGQVI